MKIYEHNINGKLYTIQRVTSNIYKDFWYEAMPHGHSVEINPDGEDSRDHRICHLEDFVVVGAKRKKRIIL